MANDNKIRFSYPVLDIVAICLALLAITVAAYGVYKSSQTSANTAETVDALNLTYQELYKIRVILENSTVI